MRTQSNVQPNNSVHILTQHIYIYVVYKIAFCCYKHRCILFLQFHEYGGHTVVAAAVAQLCGFSTLCGCGSGSAQRCECNGAQRSEWGLFIINTFFFGLGLNEFASNARECAIAHHASVRVCICTHHARCCGCCCCHDARANARAVMMMMDENNIMRIRARACGMHAYKRNAERCEDDAKAPERIAIKW